MFMLIPLQVDFNFMEFFKRSPENEIWTKPKELFAFIHSQGNSFDSIFYFR